MTWQATKIFVVSATATLLLGGAACGGDTDDGGGMGAPTAGTGGGTAAAGGAGGGGSPTGGTTGMPGSGGGGGAGSGGSGTAGSGGSGMAGSRDATVAGSGDAGVAGSRDTAMPGSGTGTDGAAGGPASQMMSFFITSRKGGGNLGGLEGADAICQMLAMAVGVRGKTWRAYLSTENPAVNARDRIGMGPWFNVRGEMVATNLTDLHDGAAVTNNLSGTTALEETGQAVPGRMNRPAGTANEHDILTGTQSDGTVAAGQTCGDWRVETSTARIGHFDRGGGGGMLPLTAATSWNSSHNNQGCAPGTGPGTVAPGGGAGRFYCFATN